ncbi:hypothetical protein V1260_03925 [Brachybacterium sp. J144]|uniref:hypothetical protein n=1 Tax=Brachybacterium sp. J144 TaxID=3116487 RepID=UPI002E75D024|nr:hypothetical protein [Brachybacterium sp. J144]MEE1649929.1 hypothetical protein [Brachybacterium sp. J144]
MWGNIRRGGAIGLLIISLALTGCTERVSERCSGRGGEHSCTVTYKSSDGKWYTTLDSNRTHSQAVVSGTFTIESGSGTLLLEGADYWHEYELSPEEPVVIEDLPLELKGDGKGTWIYLEIVADPQIEGLTAEYEWTTS